jgi:hypothetical protein
MSDRDRTLNIDQDHDRALAAALRALPDAAPQPDLWPGLARELAARRTPRAWRTLVPLALAAGLLLAVLLPRALVRESAPPEVAVVPAPTAPAVSVPDDELDALRVRSQTLERWIAAVAARAPQSSRDLMAAVEVEDLIGLVDLQLSGAHAPSDALPLWRQRVALLEDLATIRGSAFAIAANDDIAGAHDAAYHRVN